MMLPGAHCRVRLCAWYDLCFGICLAISSQPFQVLKGHINRVIKPTKALMAVGVGRLCWWHSFKRDSLGSHKMCGHSRKTYVSRLFFIRPMTGADQRFQVNSRAL